MIAFAFQLNQLACQVVSRMPSLFSYQLFDIFGESIGTMDAVFPKLATDQSFGPLPNAVTQLMGHAEHIRDDGDWQRIAVITHHIHLALSLNAVEQFVGNLLNAGAQAGNIFRSESLRNEPA